MLLASTGLPNSLGRSNAAALYSAANIFVVRKSTADDLQAG
jgi:hypothetical protein